MKKTKLKRISPKQEKELDLREQLRQELLKHVKVRDGQFICPKCNKPPDFRGLSLSHKRPLSLGGRTELANLEVICYKCHAGLHGIKEVGTKPKWSRRGNVKS